jgi:sugar phosphate isomerase/epimerase
LARIGLMLYTVRRACAEDFEATLREVSGMRFEGVELFDLHGHDPAEVRRWLDEGRLVACSRHAQLETIEAELPALAAEAEVLGWRRLVVSWVDPARLGDEDLVPRLAAAAAAARAAGLELGYHNHDAEVREGFLWRLPEDVFLELDLGWAWWSGADPVAVLQQAGDRCRLVHLKDFRARGGREFLPLGDGAVGYEHVAPAAARSGAEWLLVEQDESEGSELDAARRSLAALTSMLERAA